MKCAFTSGQAIADGMHHDDRRRELRNVLVNGQVAVNGYKFIEFDLGEARIDAFVEQDLRSVVNCKLRGSLQKRNHLSA